MRAVAKTHKEPKEPGGHPQSRPIVVADSGVTMNASGILATILTLIARGMDTVEAQATEEMLDKIDQASERLE